VEHDALIANFVRACSEPDPEAAAACVTADATFVLTGGRTLPPGPEGARAFAARHAEREGRKASVELLSTASRGPGRSVASLHFVSREVATGETMYQMTVAGVFTIRGAAISGLAAYASPEEAEASLQ
jgi:SnoaL-like protein